MTKIVPRDHRVSRTPTSFVSGWTIASPPPCWDIWFVWNQTGLQFIIDDLLFNHQTEFTCPLPIYKVKSKNRTRIAGIIIDRTERAFHVFFQYLNLILSCIWFNKKFNEVIYRMQRWDESFCRYHNQIVHTSGEQIILILI